MCVSNFTKRRSMLSALPVQSCVKESKDLQRLGPFYVTHAWFLYVSRIPALAAALFTKDFQAVIKWSDLLLAHYTQQWRDPLTYWSARQRSRSFKDICCLIIDSYDKAKICLPKFPQARTPKKVVYESIRRS